MTVISFLFLFVFSFIVWPSLIILGALIEILENMLELGWNLTATVGYFGFVIPNVLGWLIILMVIFIFSSIISYFIYTFKKYLFD
ncbi:MAG: hypothetical protein AAB868_00765 [Patescibacteria group bacterium]